MAAAARRGLLGGAVFAALLAAGCGGNGGPATPALRTVATAPATATTSTTTPRRHPARSPARTTRAAPPAAVPSQTPPPPRRARHRFVYIAEAICAQAGGGRRGPPPSSPRQLQAYLRQGLVRAQTISLLLGRLSGQTTHDSAVAKLLAEYQALVAVYQRAASSGAPSGEAGLIRRLQHRTALAARALHLEACAP